MEVVLLRDGVLTEGAASSIFVVKDGVLLMTPNSNLVLPSITYDAVRELAKKHGVAHEVRAITEREVRSADELWLASSTREVLAIAQLDGKAVGSGRPGPVFKRMYALFQELKAELRSSGGTRTHA